MGTLTLFAFGSPVLSSDFIPPGCIVPEPVYPEVMVEVDGSVLSSSFFVVGSLVQYDFPVSFDDTVGHNVRIHFLNPISFSSALSNDDIFETFCFASSGGQENRTLFLTDVVLNKEVFSWKLGNFTAASVYASPTNPFTLLQENSLAISMSTFSGKMGGNVKVRTNSSGLLQASVAAIWSDGYLEFDL